ncbi:hypothetical protein A4X09_0g2349 [Tilletia walkeri]|uniref:Carboxylic ester hydrolase n=1 Tax=Tilletia walkeri TaxID=117179 RepID=A0A8X7T6L0_9BASI|nr:hypothetical protein A4X09_0g2349 [Tilletia walkeri]
MRSFFSLLLAAAAVKSSLADPTNPVAATATDDRTSNDTAIELAGPAAEDRCTWLATNFASQSSQPINNTFTVYYPEGSNPSLELLVAQYPNGTMPTKFLTDLQKTLSDVGPDIDISADDGYGKAGGRSGKHGPLGSLPAFCRFGGSLPTSALTAVFFEVWLPLASDPSIPLAPLNTTDYPTNSTPIALGPGGQILKGPPYLLQMQVDGTLPPVNGPAPPADSTPAVNATATSNPPPTPAPPVRRLDKVHKKTKKHHHHHHHHRAAAVTGDAVFGTKPDFDGWNGRLLYIGNGAQRGFVPLTDLKQAMSRHRFAVAGSNAGHFSTSSGTSWALGPQAADAAHDWAIRAVHVARQASLEVVDLFYGPTAGARVKGENNPSKFSQDRLRSYYAGCSVGGMQGFGSVQNNPEDFDGVLVGAPALYFNRMNHGQIHNQNRHRKKSVGSAFFNITLLTTSVREIVLEQCDALDGLKDGVINQAYTCNPDFAPLLCGSTSKWGQDANACFNDTQLANLKELFQPTLYNGTFIYDRYLPGLDISPFTLTGAAAKAIGWITNAVLQNQTIPKFDGYLNQTLEIFQKGQDLNLGGSNLENADISAFLDGGKRKLIHYHGLGDLVVSPAASIRYHDEVLAAVQGKISTPVSDSYRLFTIPGMSHCRNGPGPFLFGAPTQNDIGNTPLKWDTEHDIILSLVAWTEGKSNSSYHVGASYHSQARYIPGNPALDSNTSTVANDTAALPTIYWSRDYGLRHTRKLCPWPQVAHYNGHGSTEGPDAHRSFECRDP